MKVAIVHDWFLQYGGAERVVEVLKEIWPEAPVYTAFVSRRFQRMCHPDPDVASGEESLYGRGDIVRPLHRVQNDANASGVRVGFLQHAPLISRFPRLYTPLYPFIFESLDFSEYDVVISSDAFFAKRIITKPGTVHICLSEVVPHFLYRYLDLNEALRSPEHSRGAKEGKKSWFQNLLFAPLMNYLRVGDYIAAQRVDYFVANSKTTAERIRKYYRREAEVIYLPVEVEKFKVKSPAFAEASAGRRQSKVGGYFMTVSRLTRDKRIDLAVKACSRLGLPLKVIGDGEEKTRLQKLAGSTIEFLGWKSHQEQAELYQNCWALIFPGEEDFGIVPVEAMAAGVPVVAFVRGGATETVVAGRTGEFFYSQTTEALAEVLKNFDPSKYDPKICRKRAEKFGKDVFKRKFKGFVEDCFSGKLRKDGPCVRRDRP